MSRTSDLAHQIWTAAIPDLRTTYQEVAEAGIRSVVMTQQRGEFDLLVPEQARAAGRLLTELGLAVVACHGVESQPCDLSVRDADEHAAMVRAHTALMENTAELGCRTYVVHLGGAPEEGARAEAWGQVRKAVDQLGERAEALGVALALENGFTGYIASNEELVAFARDYHQPAVGLCYDSGHAHIMGDAAEVLRLMGPYVVTVHLHDNDRSCDQHLIPGLGTIDWPSVAKALAECPRLVHAETEAANYVGWPFSPEPWSQRELWARYGEVLNGAGTGVVYG